MTFQVGDIISCIDPTSLRDDFDLPLYSEWEITSIRFNGKNATLKDAPNKNYYALHRFQLAEPED